MSLLLNDDTRYVKLLLLLLKGGTYFCKKHTLKILDNDNTTIDICLKTHRGQIFNAFKKRVINPKLWELLTPDPGQPKNLDVWDIAAHAYVLLNLFDKRLTASEKDAITKLKEKRNDLAHPGISSLPETKFLTEWSELTILLYQLSTGLTSNDKYYLNKLIYDVSAIQELDKANDELKPFEDTEDFVKEVLAEQHRSNQKRFEEFDRRISELERKVESGQSGYDESSRRISELERKNESGQSEISARITVIASEQTARDKGHHQLLKAFERCLKCGHIKQDSDEVYTACNNMFTDMSKEGAHLKNVEEGSVLVTFSCSTWTSLKRAILYLTKTLYSQRLPELEKALSQSVGCCVKLNVNIVLESLLSTLDKAEHYASNKSVVLTMSCIGLKGVRSVCDNLINGSSTNNVNNLSEALSRSVDQRIELHTSIDVDTLEEEISNLERRYEYHVTQERLKKSDEKAVGTVSISPLHSEDELVDMLTSYTPPVIEHKPYQRQVTQERQKKSYEKAISTVSVSRRYSKDLLTILGDKVVMSGYLYTKKKKFMRKYWDRCYGILTKEYLTICDNKKSKDSRKMYPISNFEWTLPDDKVDDEKHCFVITYEERHRKPLIFACDREVTRDTWIEHILEMIIMCKNFSADSAYASGGSISSRQVERTGMYSVIDELKITSTEDSTPYQHNLLETSEAIYDLCYIDDYKDDFENVVIINEDVNGFMKVQQKPDETRQKATTGSGAIDPRMDTLKHPLPETSGASSDLCSVEGYKDDYENVQIIDEDVNTLRKKKVTLSNKQPDSGFMKVQQNTDETRLKSTYGSKAIEQSMVTLKLPVSKCIGARSDSRSVDDDQDNYENDDIIKEVFGAKVKTIVISHRISNRITTTGEKTVKKCNQSTESDKEIVDSHETEEVVLRSISNSPSNSETSRSSGDYDQIQENVTIADDSKTLRKKKVTLSIKQPDSGFMKVQQNTDETRLKSTYGSKAIEQSMVTLKLPLSECIGARNDSRSDDGDQDNYENDDIIKNVFGADVNTLRRNKGMKTAGEKTVKKCNQSTESDMEIVDSHETEELVLRSTSNSPSRSETSSSSGDSDEIYENVTIADDSKRFKPEEYMCYDQNNKTKLSQMPEGTFCVRPGRYTKQELAITKADGKISVFRIYEQVGCVYLSEGQQFLSLDDLINYYRQTVLPTEKYKLTLMRGFHS